MLLEEFDPARNAVIEPEMVAKKIDGFPEVTVSCFSKSLFDSVLRVFDAKKIGELHFAFGRNPVYEVVYKGQRFALFQSCVGEPTCAAQYEDLIAMGSKRLILLGNCGVLDRSIEDCGIIIPTAALRDEGTSYHYQPPSDSLAVNHKYRELSKMSCGNAAIPGWKASPGLPTPPTGRPGRRLPEERPKGRSAWRWSAQACRPSATSGTRSSFSSSMPGTIWTTRTGSPAACPAKRAWTTRRRSCSWPSSLA